MALLFDRKLKFYALDLLLDPCLLYWILNVHVLNADRAAVRRTKDIENRSKGHAVAAGESTSEEFTIEIPNGEAIGRGVKFGMKIVLGEVEWIEIGVEVASNAVHVDESSNLKVLFEHQILVIVGVDVVSPVDRFVGKAK
ncbi:unannotated protein [freshwater metagenome]|uniref:Unannotated protein n=1 Tax=freshwater metagenome TaxID=449393 RepID=A0A6J6JPL7_9ZZZZ